jgi:hypothetical protein
MKHDGSGKAQGLQSLGFAIRSWKGMREPDYILDLSTLSAPTAAAPANPLAGRPWLAVHWRCCSVYSRVYRNRAGSAYEGRCPGCGRPLNVRIGPGGTSERFFEAY